MSRVAHPGCWSDRQTDWLAMEDSRWGCTCCGWWGDNHWSWADGGNWSCQSGHVPEDTGKVEFDLDGNLVDEWQRRKKKDKRTKNTDDENENDIARCDEGRRVKVGVKKQNIEDNEGQKKMKGNEERGNRRTKTYEMDCTIAHSIPWHILVIRCAFLLSVSVRFSRFSQFWHHNNHRYAAVIQDLTKQWIQSYLCKTTTSQETQKSLQKILEPTRKPKVIYTDNALEFGKSCEDLSWNHSTSTQHRSETNGIAERAVRTIKEGTSSVLLQSGLDDKEGVYVTLGAKPKWLPCPTVVTWRDKTLWSIGPSRPKRRRDDYEWIDDGNGALENPKNE